MNYSDLIKRAPKETLQKVLCEMLEPHFQPVFGAAKLIEHEVVALRVLKQLKGISENYDEYELVTKLRVTRPKARALMYQEALRRVEMPQQLDQEIKSLLFNPSIQKDGGMVLIEVPQPLLMDVLRQKVRKLGYLSDGSFSGSFARIPVKALAELMVEYIPKADRPQVEARLRKQGVEGSGLQDVLLAFIKKVGQSAAGSAGEQVAEKIGEGLSNGLSQAWSQLLEAVKADRE